MKNKKNTRFWITLTVFGLIGQVAWVVENMYFNVFIYKMFHATPEDISAMVALSAVSATLTTVFMGALSDRLGKRKLFMWLGYLLWGISIFCFVFLKKDLLTPLSPESCGALAGIQLAIFLDCVMTFFGSSANDAAYNAWLTDSTDETNRGAAEGINSMMPLVAILVVFGGFMFFDLNLEESWTKIFSIMGILVCAVGLFGLFLIREKAIKPSKDGYFKSILHGFSPKTVKENATLYLRLVGFAVFNVAIQIFMPYLIIYYEVSLGMKDYVLIMAPAIVLAAAFTAFWGKVYDKKGFRFSGLIALFLLLAGFVLLLFTRTSLPVFAGSLLMMCGYLSGMAVFGASIREYTPEGMAGRFQGIRIFSQVLLPGVIGPMIGKQILSGAEVLTGNDGTVSFVPNADIFLGAAVVAIAVLPFLLFSKKKRVTVPLFTPYEAERPVPFAEYPRPTMKRDSYLSLNGNWDFALEKKGKTVFSSQICVPFPPESRLSGVERSIGRDETMVYRRTFTLPDGFQKERVLLHFGAVDQTAEVFLNGTKLGSHEDGYLSFSFDVTAHLKEVNELTVRASDPMALSLPYGKQTEKPGGMWYTKVSGIWQSVWMESVPKDAVERLTITPELDRIHLRVLGGKDKKKLILREPNAVREITFIGESLTLTFPEPRLWTPEDPYLYRFDLVTGEDRVESYFALRTVEVKRIGDKPYLCLNGKPYYFHGLLDQGYFPDGIFLPGEEEGYRQDILKMKACGFNMLRKHIKLEPEIFYYECDRLGMAVFQDMINAGKYSFLRDTALPTLGIKRGIRQNVPAETRKAFLRNASEMQARLYNHPSVVYYTVFNEGWGQFDADKCYQICKENDPTRIYDATSGWFWETLSDVHSEHIYFKALKPKTDPNRPLVLSEFGGYSYKKEGHVFNEKETYGYRFFRKEKDFREALLKLYTDELSPLFKEGLCASVLTQLSDVEDETNGLFTYDRRHLKVSCEEMARLSEQLQNDFQGAARG